MPRWIDGYTGGWRDGGMDRQTDRWISGCMDDRWMKGWMGERDQVWILHCLAGSPKGIAGSLARAGEQLPTNLC